MVLIPLSLNWLLNFESEFGMWIVVIWLSLSILYLIIQPFNFSIIFQFLVLSLLMKSNIWFLESRDCLFLFLILHWILVSVEFLYVHFLSIFSLISINFVLLLFHCFVFFSLSLSCFLVIFSEVPLTLSGSCSFFVYF